MGEPIPTIDQVPLRHASGPKRDVTVLVTGFGPFQDKFPINPSFEITKSLPQSLPPLILDGTKINIIPWGNPIRVNYAHVRNGIPKIHESLLDRVDLVLHIGMASGRNFYTVEEIGHRDGYHKNQDVDGNVLPEDNGVLRFADCPADMTSSLNYPEILRKWQMTVLGLAEESPGFGADCRPSQDAGHYLCDYIYFNSLAWYGRRSGNMIEGMASDRPVLFLHVPAESDEEALARGRAVTIALIETMVEELVLSRAKLMA